VAVSTPYQLTTREDRASARRRRRRRHIAIATVSTVIIIGGLIARILTASGWPDVRRSFFSEYWFRKAFGSVLSGFWTDVRMFLIIEVVVLALGLLIALIRTFEVPVLYPVRMLAIAFVDVMRGVPTILLIFLLGFSVPALNLRGIPTSAVVLGGAALAMNYSAYVSEVFRAGLMSVHPSQGSAALALGLTPAQALRHVIVPQAVRVVVPPLLNDFIALQKDVALLSTLGVFEGFRAAQIIADQNFNYTPLLAAAALYLCVTIPLVRFVDHLQWSSLRQRGALLALGPR
jgi:polar amino acid transport system permease protein